VTLAIETTGLTKRFGQRTVVDSVDLAVPEGSVFGFLGPNGSGKTTTIRMLLGLAFATSGRIELLGHQIPRDAARALPEVGALVEGPGFYPFLSGRANLVRMDEVGQHPLVGARGSRRDRVDTALGRVGLNSAAEKRYRQYSLGMRQRLAIAAALLWPTRLLVLDEPTNGLDPQGMREVRGLIRGLAGDGMTVFVSSHLLSEVEQICTDAAVLSVGRVVAQGTLESLRGAQARVLRVETPDTSAALAVLWAMPGVGTAALVGGAIEVTLAGAEPEECTAALVGGGVRVRSLVSVTPSLEDTFVALTGEGFDVAG
jgi:ABC-2 type transport system ATP-binding protein